MVVTSSEPLKHHISRIKPAVTIRNGCEYEFFANAQDAGGRSRPRIGFVGAVSDWFDLELVVALAKANTSWDFEIYGSYAELRDSIPTKIRNLRFHGEIPYQSVANVVSSFDVGIIPFKVTEMTKFVNPIKMYEYIAAGTPVVTSPLPECKGLEDVDVFLADGASQFADRIQLLLERQISTERLDECRKFAAQNDWKVMGAKIP